jgi:branched-chain amino acid transport system permease protein
MSDTRLRSLSPVIAVFAVLALIPLLPAMSFSSNLEAILTTAFLVGFMGFGWNVVSGYIGYLSLGEYLFFGIGAYSAGYGLAELGLPPYAGLVVAIVVVIAVTGVVSSLVTRLAFRGLYYALLTLAVAEIGRILVASIPALGRYGGLYLPTRDDPVQLLFLGSTKHYYLNLVLLVLGGAFAFALHRSRIGRQMRALADDEIAARSLGVPLRRRLWQASAISGIFFAIGGMATAVESFFVRPTTVLELQIVVDVLIVVMIGGLGFVWAPLVGMLVVAGIRFGIAQAGAATTTAAQLGVIVEALIVLAVVAIRRMRKERS